MEEIKKWIMNCYSFSKLSFDSCLFISGISGSGKSYLINKIIKDLNLFHISIDSNNCLSSLQLIDYLNKSFNSSLIQILTNNTSNKIIVIDDFDILNSIDNTINLSIYNFILNNIGKLKNIPIIIIINNDVIKKIGEIKKKCKIIEIKKLSEYEIYDILKNYKKDIEFGEALKIIGDTDYNINEAIKMINNLRFNKCDNFLDYNDLYTSNFNRNNLKKLLLKEQWIISLNFHENLINELSNRKGKKKDKEEYYKKFIINFCYFDLFMNKSNEISLDLFISIIKNLYDFPNKKEKRDKQNFTKMLSYLSLQKKNNKNAFKSSFPFQQIGKYHSNIINRKFIY
jgi:ABC-type polar amino acid transport system ATPase subunit